MSISLPSTLALAEGRFRVASAGSCALWLRPTSACGRDRHRDGGESEGGPHMFAATTAEGVQLPS